MNDTEDKNEERLRVATAKLVKLALPGVSSRTQKDTVERIIKMVHEKIAQA